MTIVQASDFRKNMSRYLELAITERVIITHRNGKAFELVPDAAIVDNGEYFSNPAVLQNLNESIRQAKEGRMVEMSPEEFGNEFGL